MMSGEDSARGAGAVLDKDEVESVLAGAYYRPASSERPKFLPASSAKPAHYKVICISMYTRDLEQLDAMVDELKARGFTKANRSALIRHALAEVDLSKVPHGL